MRTIAILSNKGGAGKTTLALNLAVTAIQSGQAVAVIDLDPQVSAAGWKDSREGDDPVVIAVPYARLQQALETARKGGVDLVVIDTPPNTEQPSLAAARAADLILIPCRPGILDIRAIGITAEAVKVTGKPAYVILNTLPVQASRIVEDATLAIAEHGLAVAPIIMHQRASYNHALTIGQTVEEYEPNGKAAEEMRQLWTWIGKLG